MTEPVAGQVESQVSEPVAVSGQSQPESLTSSEQRAKSFIKQLRDAEQAGLILVEKTRKRAKQKLKAAQIEANKEIEEFRKKKRTELEQKIAAKEEDRKREDEDIGARVEGELQQIARRVQITKKHVIDLLEVLITNLHPQLHHNLTSRKILSNSQTKSFVPADPHLCDEYVWMLLAKCTHLAEKSFLEGEHKESIHNFVIT
ncbi:hypothetical protein WR25_24665 [Diploscapter pachys]|uniref:V-type proton ATPase subunit G n=1 Tax=Diploscapter pachys TaxID=2018661 RepID=A0A2A2KFG7_9BILA|nr:hypothetical protein WR25_24665 [Diploscapter pachys]